MATTIRELDKLYYDREEVPRPPRVHIVNPNDKRDGTWAYCGAEIGHIIEGGAGPRPDRCIECAELHNEWKARYMCGD